MFFNDFIRNVSDFKSLCAPVLQGFTCAAASSLDTERLQELAKAIKEKNISLGKDQLLCLANKLMLHGIPRDFNNYPNDLVLFLSPSDYGAIGSCKEYVAHVGKANIDVLEKGSPQRRQLLAEALDCLKISGLHVSEENAEILGHLVCDLSADYFKTSGKNMLKQLTRCQSFSVDQAKAIQAILCSGDTPVGPPSEWSSSTLEKLSGLFQIFDYCILQQIPASVLLPRLKCFRHTPYLLRKELASLVKNLQPARLKRSSDSQCPPGKNVTDEIAQDDLMPIEYTVEELRDCLGIPVLIRNLGTLSTFAFTDEQLPVIKAKLDETGYPDQVLRNLGDFKDLMSLEDIKKWKFNSTETLASLLNDKLSPEGATAIIHQYTDSGGPLNAAALNVIGTKYICLLDSDQLERIDENAINGTNPLDLSNCTQTTKDILYPKAKRAFSDRHNPPRYYGLIKSYLGGAPGDDLRALSKDGVNMDINTFMKLRPDSLLSLTPSNVKGLLGEHLKDLKGQENNSPVKEWIARQKQSDLDQLGIGLVGGTPDGYVNITPRHHGPPEASGATKGHSLHLYPSLLLTLLLTSFLS
ncbi:mesothelin-like [Eublepharis macularius]|uniref:Mesothelin-like n=1 Tax=Eublepharis macularius TaxID=481883 RepID=A0AA97K599_EUBMA|nr:mesothelin-like [Eublepharis macularius]